MANSKKVIYQVLIRAFGNTNTTNKPWGNINENGVGKFNDFSDIALNKIRQLGVTHIWYTGVLHHTLCTDYSKYHINNDPPSIVKGKAGSPYAIKDYYSVNPDLASNPMHRLEEFEALIKRTHQHGLNVIIDIVPNHVARNYKSANKIDNIINFGDEDDCKVEYQKDNNFYYIVGSSFQAPTAPDQKLDPGTMESSSLAYHESPAKWTGNGARKSNPDINDWYDTAKLNFGIRPDGHHDFQDLPSHYAQKSTHQHYLYWQNKSVPSTWKQFRDITQYWLEKGVNGFRFDMAEMVPIEFWSYLNSSIKNHTPNAFLLAEVYKPELYKDFIYLGRMDYLYDKVDLYDTLKSIIQGKGKTSEIVAIQKKYHPIEHHMVHFLENHDEQRIASEEFAGNATRAKPAMLLSATLTSAPTLVYFGQEVGEPAKEDAGFGQPSRTSIFDYVGVPNHQKWMNNGHFDGGQLTKEQHELRLFYQNVLNFSLKNQAITGDYHDLYSVNTQNLSHTMDDCFIFARSHHTTLTIIATNFSHTSSYLLSIDISHSIISKAALADGHYLLQDKISQLAESRLIVEKGQGQLKLNLPILAAFAFTLH